MLRSILLLNRCAHYDVKMWEHFEEMGFPPEAFITEGTSLWEKLKITDYNISIMTKALSSGWIDRELDGCERRGVKIITFRDPDFPQGLLKIRSTPLMLYVKGRMPSMCVKTIAVVGTRRCSSYALKTAREIGAAAAGQGWNVISGGAKGVDGASHSGCLDSGGITAAVLGTGIDVVYPHEHRELFERIQERGALLTEYGIGSKGDKWRFPRRNRIIVGLASRIVLVEAPYKSGAMITANLAAEEGREVWAVPGRIDDERCGGSNRLIFDGATPLIDFDLFFGTEQRYAERHLFDDDTPALGRKNLQSLSDDERKILSLLSIHGANTIDNLAGEAKMSAAEVFKLISVMSLRGLVAMIGPGRYSLCD
ncbi:MAG: DNA-processing protein DprA [Synergistaceae bacterium]|jgi:DNA processing protein|nr:DNA-processing protein DprA [Synergistaceae bacterium]